MITISLFYFSKMVFIHMSIWMIGKNSMKLFYLKHKISIATWIWKILVYRLRARKLVEYHNLYVKIDTLLLTDVFENFRNMHLEIYELDPTKFFFNSWISMRASLKKAKVKLDFLTDIDTLLMIEKSIIVGVCHSVYRYAKANNKYIRDYDKNKESS